jgi:hypothetical protein
MRGLLTKLLLATILFALLVCIVGLAGRYWRDHSRTPIDYFVPRALLGKDLKIFYSVPGEKELSIRDGRLIVKMPSTGILKTSTEFESGAALDRWFIVEGNKTWAADLKKIRTSSISNSKNGKTVSFKKVRVPSSALSE